MCRLLGWAASKPISLAGLLGEADLAAFTELSCKHGDGWGLAHAAGDGVVVQKAPDAARLSPAFAEAASDARELAMVHLRWATLGLPVCVDNAHPFTDGRLALAHNGSISPPQSLDPLLDDRVRSLLSGDTDSERFFLAILSRLPDGAADDDEIGRAYADTVRAIAGSLAFSSLNSMLLTPTRLFAVCCFDPDAEARESEPEYYRMRYRTTAGAVVVCSSGWGSGWQELGNGELLSVDRGSLTLTVSPLDLP